MPRRRRTNKRRHVRTMSRDLMLTLGPPPGQPPPEPGSEEWQALRACFHHYRFDADGRDNYHAGTWGHTAFEVGDVDAALRANPLTLERDPLAEQPDY